MTRLFRLHWVFVLFTTLAGTSAFSQTAPPPKPGKEPIVEEAPTPNPERDAIRDELELLNAQLEVKKATLKAISQKQKAAEDRAKQLENVPGLAAAEVSASRNLADSLGAEVLIRTAELKEQEVKITLAKRRLIRVPETLAPEAPDPLRDIVQALAKAEIQRAQQEKTDRAARFEQDKKDKAARMEQEKKEQSAREAERLARELERVERQKQEEEKQRLIQRANLESSLKQVLAEQEQARSKAKLLEIKIGQLKLEAEGVKLQLDEVTTMKARLDILQKDIEKQLKGEPK